MDEDEAPDTEVSEDEAPDAEVATIGEAETDQGKGRRRRERGEPRSRRRRKPTEPAHEHVYEEKSAVGGIIRRVCTQCGHVSFGSEDVYEDWSG